MPVSRPATLRSTAGATSQAIQAVMPRARHSRVTLPRLNAKVSTTMAAVMTVTARRVSAAPGSGRRGSCEGAGITAGTVHPLLGLVSPGAGPGGLLVSG